MGAPLTVEQIILNHNIGVNLSDAGTFKGHELEEFSMVGHQHMASEITSGVFSPSRLPVATQAARGIVSLSPSTSSDASDLAATPSAVKAVKLMAEAKANATHKHNPDDLNAGTFTEIIKAMSNTSYTTKQVRNIFLSTSAPQSTDGSNGDIWFQYE